MKYLVTGATGFIGMELCRQICQSGQELIAYSLSGGPLPDGTPTRAIDFRVANLSATDLESVDVVLHLAGIAHQRASPEDYRAVNHRAAVELARQAQLANVSCFVFLSSVKAMGPSGDVRPRTEFDCCLPVDPYGLSKQQAESELNSEFATGSMRVCILRPALVYGLATKANLAQLSKAVGKGLPRPPEEGARSMIGVKDLSVLMLAVAADTNPGVSTFIVTDGEAYTTRRIYDALREARGLKPGVQWCPRWAWWLGSWILDALRTSSDSTWSKLFSAELYSNDAVVAATGWRPKQSFESLLGETGGRL